MQAIVLRVEPGGFPPSTPGFSRSTKAKATKQGREGPQMEEQQFTLNFEGAVDVARWTCRAWESGHFDWNLLAGDDAQENIAERWRLIRWLNDEHHLDCLDIEDSEDREVCGAIMFAFVTSPLRMTAEREHVTPQDWIDIALTSAEGVEEMRLAETLVLGGDA